MKFANTEDAKHPFLKSIQHGDLNCRNILVASSQQDERSARELFRLIDFEKSSQQSALPDICWLSLWMLAASEHPPEPEVGDWNAMTFQFVATVLNQEGDDRFLGSFQIGIDLVKCLLGDVWELPNTYPNPVERGLLDNTIRKQFALTLCACAVAMCAYEVRRFNRAIERGASEDVDPCRNARLWGCSYFRIGARALKEYVPFESGASLSTDLGSLMNRVTAATASKS